MTHNRILDSNRILQVEARSGADTQLLKHIKSTVLGTPGRLRYQLTGIEEKLDHIRDIDFMVLTRKDRILGSVGFVYRNSYFRGESVKSYYIRFFSINAPLRSKKQHKDNFRDQKRGSNMIRDISFPYVADPSRLKGNSDSDERSFVYAYVESQNFRSMNFGEQIIPTVIGKYKTIIFSRLNAKPQSGLRRIQQNEKKLMRGRIMEMYHNYNLFTDENLFFENNYFVLEEDGEIVAGAQVHPETWKILEMKGRMNKFLLKVLPYVPVMRKIFNPSAFRFLGVEGIWVKKGCEGYLDRFFEGLCHLFHCHFILTWADIQSDLYKMLVTNLDPGIIGGAFKTDEVDIRVQFNNFTGEEKPEYFSTPSYLSAYDMV